MSAPDLSEVYLLRSWWIIFPSFSALTIRLAAERACANPYDLLPALTSSPTWAWPLALVYVLAHVWILGAYLRTASKTSSIVPPFDAWRSVWGSDLGKLILMVLAMAIEYAPVPMWRLIGEGLQCAR